MDAQAEKRRALLALYVAGARLGKTRDFAGLADLAGPRLFAHARRLSDDPDTARNIVQEAWAEIAKGLHQLRDDRAFFPWALAIVGGVAARDLSLLRTARRYCHATHLHGIATERNPLVRSHLRKFDFDLRNPSVET